MRFKKNDTVYIKEPLGRLVGKKEDIFYYGGNLSIAPIRTKCVVVNLLNLDPYKITASFVSTFGIHKTWIFHPDELSYTIEKYSFEF